ncbi:MAG: hypothetical protein LBV02_02760 [Bacteroidales bacterium]|jgi:hypothetical protein|nr:hypothetical protein [Bacteroidales bacterium]
MNKKIDILLTRYFIGEATAEEIQQVDQWITESKENENYFTGFSSLYQNLLTSSVQIPKLDLNKAFDRFAEP